MRGEENEARRPWTSPKYVGLVLNRRRSSPKHTSAGKAVLLQPDIQREVLSKRNRGAALAIASIVYLVHSQTIRARCSAIRQCRRIGAGFGASRARLKSRHKSPQFVALTTALRRYRRRFRLRAGKANTRFQS